MCTQCVCMLYVYMCMCHTLMHTYTSCTHTYTQTHKAHMQLTKHWPLCQLVRIGNVLEWIIIIIRWTIKYCFLLIFLYCLGSRTTLFVTNTINTHVKLKLTVFVCIWFCVYLWIHIFYAFQTFAHLMPCLRLCLFPPSLFLSLSLRSHCLPPFFSFCLSHASFGPLTSYPLSWLLLWHMYAWLYNELFIFLSLCVCVCVCVHACFVSDMRFIEMELSNRVVLRTDFYLFNFFKNLQIGWFC